MANYLIFAHPYDEKVGGIVCLHKLCDTINRSGGKAFIFPYFESFEINKRGVFLPLRHLLAQSLKQWKKFAVNPEFITPVLASDVDVANDDWIVVYPEVVFGNPLGAKRVVRWLLHNPGFHTGKIYYGENELHVKFNDAIKPFHYPHCHLAKNNLKVIHYPLEHYHRADANTLRRGTAVCIRKGKGKKFVHDERDSVVIDGKSHKEVALILNRVSVFVSYDTYTAYSLFAVLCGCDSVVIPDPGVDQASWYPDPKDRDGIAYGFERIAEARLSAPRVLPRIIAEHADVIANTQKFMVEAETFFSLRSTTCVYDLNV